MVHHTRRGPPHQPWCTPKVAYPTSCGPRTKRYGTSTMAHTTGRGSHQKLVRDWWKRYCKRRRRPAKRHTQSISIFNRGSPFFCLYRFVTSAPFRFLIGPNKKLITVHSALVAYHSERLGVLVNGSILDAKEGCAILEDVKGSNFILFVQSTYTRDFIAADSDIMIDSSVVAAESCLERKVSLNSWQSDLIRYSKIWFLWKRRERKMRVGLRR